MYCEPINQNKKPCKKCKTVKPFSNFYKDKSGKKGLRPECMDCTKEFNKRLKNRAKIDIAHKVCRNCKKTKDINLFTKDYRSIDGFRYNCRECVKKYNQKKKERLKITIEYKQCSICSVIKSRGEFHSWSYSVDGIDSRCIDCVKQYKIKYRKENPMIIKKQNKERYEKNKPASFAKSAKQRAERGQAAPPWLSEIQKNQIKWFYAASKMMTETSGMLHHVDHIHPIKGKNFTGLHVPWNLQIIRASDNLKKNNRPPSNQTGLFWL